jgi:hypothetical protein
MTKDRLWDVPPPDEQWAKEAVNKTTEILRDLYDRRSKEDIVGMVRELLEIMEQDDEV